MPEEVRYKDSELALERRFSGEPLPVPVMAEGVLGDVIRKACAFLPSDRYDSAAVLKRDLLHILTGMSAPDKNTLVTPVQKEAGAQEKSTTADKMPVEPIMSSINSTASLYGQQPLVRMGQTVADGNEQLKADGNPKDNAMLNSTVSIFSKKQQFPKHIHHRKRK